MTQTSNDFEEISPCCLEQDVSFIKQLVLFRDEFSPKLSTCFIVFFGAFGRNEATIEMISDPPQGEISPIRFVLFFFRDFNVCWTNRPCWVAEVSWQIFRCLKLFVPFLKWDFGMNQLLVTTDWFMTFFWLKSPFKTPSIRNPADMGGCSKSTVDRRLDQLKLVPMNC